MGFECATAAKTSLCCVVCFSVLLPHFNGHLHFKAIVHPKPIFNSTLYRFRPRWDFSNLCNHSGVSQTETTRLTHCQQNGSLVLKGKQKTTEGRRVSAPLTVRTCSLQFVITAFLFCFLRPRQPPSQNPLPTLA